MGERTVPAISPSTMLEVDRLMTDRYGIHLMQMMEHAGAHLARLSMQRFIGPAVAGCTIIVLAGTGGNGGGALVCARHLHNQGVRVRVALTRSPDEYAGVPPEVYHDLGIDLPASPIFVDGSIVALARSEPGGSGPPRFVPYSECLESLHG